MPAVGSLVLPGSLKSRFAGNKERREESGREPGQETNHPGVAQDISPYAIENVSANSGQTVNWVHSSQRGLTL